MDYVKKYGELIKDKAGVKPERARSMIRLGLRAENARTKLLPNKEMPKAFVCDPSGDGKCVKGSGSSGEILLDEYFCPSGDYAVLWSAVCVHGVSVIIYVRF